MTRPRLLLSLSVVFLLVTAGAYVGLYGSRPGFENPVLANDAPDPSVLRADGSYYAYTTQAYFDARFTNVPILRSEDLVSWELVGDAFPENPSWTVPSPGDMWAPHVVAWDDGTYRLYFSAARRDTGEMAIGVATAPHPTGPFTDSGGPLVTGRTFTAIDPFVLDDGVRYLFWGSAGGPIWAQELSSDGLSLAAEPREVLRPSAGEYEGLIEGAWLTVRDGLYYLWYSGDSCCGPEAHYAVMVARSDSPLGPYRRNPDNPILQGNDRFDAPGHHAVIRGPDGDDWILYLAMVWPDTTFRSLFLDRIEWIDRWPLINGGRGPSACSTDAPHDPLPRLLACDA